MENEKGTAQPIETVQDVLTPEQVEVLKVNLSNQFKKQGYEEGKVAAIEMTLKEQKRKFADKFGIDTEGIKDFDTLFEKALTAKLEKEKTEVTTKKQSEIEKVLSDFETVKKDKEILQTKISEIQKEYEIKLQETENKFIQMNIDSELSKEISNIPFDVPQFVQDMGDAEISKFLQIEKMKLETLLKNNFKFQFDNGKVVISKDGEILKDKIQNPLKLSDIAIQFAKENYFNLKSEKSVNQTEGKKYGNNMLNVKSLADFDKFMQEKGISKGTNEYLTYYADFRNNNKT